MAIAHQTGTACSGDVEIFFRRLGKPGAAPLLIVHGLSYFSWDWLPVAETLGADREVILMDMRGFGDSGWSAARDYSVPSMAQDVLAVLEHAAWRQAVLIGHSMGGRSTSYVAARQPARVAALALVDFTPENAPGGSKRITQVVANTPDAFSSIEEAMKHFGKEDRPRFEAYLKKTANGFAIKRDPYFRDQFKRTLETGERPKLGVDMWQVLGEVRCPILSLRGARSDMYAPETKEKMKAVNPRLQVVEVDAGHNIAGENPKGFVAAVQAFLASLEKTHEYERR
jgi:pimeloyl-ACP methyl ester carboxylesterase